MGETAWGGVREEKERETLKQSYDIEKHFFFFSWRLERRLFTLRLPLSAHYGGKIGRSCLKPPFFTSPRYNWKSQTRPRRREPRLAEVNILKLFAREAREAYVILEFSQMPLIISLSAVLSACVDTDVAGWSDLETDISPNPENVQLGFNHVFH